MYHNRRGAGVKPELNTYLHPGLIIAALCIWSCGKASRPQVVISEADQAFITLAADDSLTMYAAHELQRLVTAATGLTLPISKAGSGSEGYEIQIGWNEQTAALATELTDDSYLWSSSEQRFIIGGPGRGTLYGVYAFLENHLALRYYAPDVISTPELSSFAVPRVDETHQPAFPVRWVHLPGGEEQAWCDWHGIHSRAHRSDSWGMFVHTFHQLVPPEIYFEERPEYFSEIKGNRLPNLQLCLTNEDVFQLVVDGLRERMAERPYAQLWSVSQNDCHGACQCAECQSLVDRHGSQQGPLLTFVNRVAAEFPEKTISTLAYSYTRQAPRDLIPAPNVNICLCSIECDRAQPLAESGINADFYRDVQEWSALTDNLMIWDYVVQFTNYVSPFPNFHVLQPNIQLFRDHNVQLMFQQGSGSARSDFSELKQYLIAKLLWNPDRDVDALIDDFMAGYYQEAAPLMRSYFDLLHYKLVDSGAGLGIYGNPVLEGESWLTPSTLLEAEIILQQAAEAVVDMPEVMLRVTRVALAVTYARLEQAKRYGAGEHGLFKAEPDGSWQVQAEWKKLLDSFVNGCRTAGYDHLHERYSPPEEYDEITRRCFQEGMVRHLAAGRQLDYDVPHSPKYPAEGPATLVDGIKGINDYWYSWLGWEASDLAVTIDLEHPREISRLAADFLQVTASWVWLPVEVRWQTSLDGENWQTAARLRPQAETDRSDPFVERFECSFPTRQARFVRLEADNITHCPPWHHGAGGEAWLFCDELMVFE